MRELVVRQEALGIETVEATSARRVGAEPYRAVEKMSARGHSDMPRALGRVARFLSSDQAFPTEGRPKSCSTLVKAVCSVLPSAEKPCSQAASR